MTTTRSSLLHRALVVDAVISGMTALAMLAAAAPLAGLLQVPASLLRGAGIALIPFVAYLALVIQRRSAGGHVRLVIALNVAWVLASIALLFSARVNPTALGVSFILVQAAAVAALAEAQFVGLRRVTSM